MSLNWGRMLLFPKREITLSFYSRRRASTTYFYCAESSSFFHCLSIYGIRSSRLQAFFLKVWGFAFSIASIRALSFDVLYLDLAVLPIRMASISISPVSGSVADCCIAVRTNWTAFSTSLSLTSVESLILAKASLIRMSDSSCRGVAVIIFLLFPTFLIYR